MSRSSCLFQTAPGPFCDVYILTESTFQDGGGFAVIFGPDGGTLVDRLPAGAEGILIANIGLKAIDFAKNVCDPVGQYSRADLLSLNVNEVAAKQVHHF
jgi:nitrilase